MVTPCNLLDIIDAHFIQVNTLYMSKWKKRKVCPLAEILLQIFTNYLTINKNRVFDDQG